MIIVLIVTAYITVYYHHHKHHKRCNHASTTVIHILQMKSLVVNAIMDLSDKEIYVKLKPSAIDELYNHDHELHDKKMSLKITACET